MFLTHVLFQTPLHIIVHNIVVDFCKFLCHSACQDSRGLIQLLIAFFNDDNVFKAESAIKDLNL